MAGRGVNLLARSLTREPISRPYLETHGDSGQVIEAVIFDLDGVLIDSEQTWSSAREQLARERGGTWREQATREMMGMSSPEWSCYMRDGLGVDMEPEEIAAEVVRRMEALYREHLPIIDGAREAVSALSAHWPLGLASSANRRLIELVLDLAGMREHFAAAVSAEEVAHGKPAPDVYLAAARRIGVKPRLCAAVEDSTNGLRAAASAGMLVIAVPNREFPPTEEALGLAEVVLESLDQLRTELFSRLEPRDR